MIDRQAEPLDVGALTRVGGQLGTNPAGVFEDTSGRRYYVKFLESNAHATNERIAASLYELASAPTLTYVRTVAPDQVATRWLRLDKKHVSSLSEAELKAARHWFGVHAWTANWDAAGFDGDNQGVWENHVLTLDVGGALEFRAQGYPKGRAFGDEVGEVDRLRTDPLNPYARKVFGPMDEQELLDALEVVTHLSDDQIRAAILENQGRPALAEKMLRRKADLERRVRALARLRGPGPL